MRPSFTIQSLYDHFRSMSHMKMQRKVRSASVFNKIRLWEFEDETAAVFQTGALIIT